MEEFKALGHRLQRVAENKRNLPMSQIQLPNYLFIEAPGCGVTTHIRMITDLLQELRLIPFEGDRRYFEWVLDENAFKEKGGGFERLLDEITVMAGFHSHFKGVIGLEIDAWQDKADSDEFTRLLDLADDCLGQILFIFTVQIRDNGDPDALIRRLSAEMPLEVVHCPLPSTDNMALYLGDFLRRRHFRVSLATIERLKVLLPELTKAKAFDGFQTLDNLADEIVYRFCASGDRNEDQLIEPDDLQFIDEPDGYVDRLSNRGSKKRHRSIGFQTGGERL
ncbi:MAG: hypothetical protein IJG07_10615 [Prevotella sp.]|nr:hypothetical protein [Prevotella sp.]